jgi:phytoene dehydrogenase-like protein
MGINADLKNYPERLLFKLQKPLQTENLETENREIKYLLVSNYASDPDYSPTGKTVLTMQLPGDSYEFWQKAKNLGSYEAEKKKLADTLIAEIGAQMPEAYGKVEVCDIATPLTFQRYCHSWKGSWMTAMGADFKLKTYPQTIKGLTGVYFAGHRLMPPGGLPPALMTGRTAVQHLCRDTGTLFVAE